MKSKGIPVSKSMEKITPRIVGSMNPRTPRITTLWSLGLPNPCNIQLFQGSRCSLNVYPIDQEYTRILQSTHLIQPTTRNCMASSPKKI